MVRFNFIMASDTTKINIKDYINTYKVFPTVIDTSGLDAIKLYTKPKLLKPYCKSKIDTPDMDEHVQLPADVATPQDLRDYIDSFHDDEGAIDLEDKKLKDQKKGWQSVSGSAHGIHFDSKWEYAFYVYAKNIEGWSIDRNNSDYLYYLDASGKRRKFYYDFIVNGQPYEVKGIFRANDTLKMEQCPQVTFIYGEQMKKILKLVRKEFPDWEKQFIAD